MSAILAYILGHAFNWLKILLVFFALDTIFRVIVATGWLDNILKIAWYIENIGLFKLFPENAIVFILNVFYFVLSIDVLMHIVGRHHLPKSHNAPSHAAQH